jgi:hypothetical protein
MGEAYEGRDSLRIATTENIPNRDEQYFPVYAKEAPV